VSSVRSECKDKRRHRAVSSTDVGQCSMGGFSGLQKLTESGERRRGLFHGTIWRLYRGEDKTYLKGIKCRIVDCFRIGYDRIRMSFCN
jgi:hypothetical protein